ncbi:MAG: hypothetical protein OCD00_19985 [Colwellia sp.]
MANTVLKYSATFLIGALFSYLIASQENPYINNQTNEKSPIDSSSIAEISKDDNQFIKKQRQTKQNLLVKCNEEISHLTKKLDADTPQQLTPESVEHENQQLLTKLLEVISENSILKHKLEQLEPSTVSNEQIKAIIPKDYAPIVSTFSGKIKEQIVDLHQQEEDLNWGLRKQQELLYFINSHQNGHEILITSLLCKVNQCQLILDEKITPASLKQAGLNDDEIKTITSSHQPKYKKIFDDLLLQPDLNLMSVIYTPNRFGIYALLKDKSQLNKKINLL